MGCGAGIVPQITVTLRPVSNHRSTQVTFDMADQPLDHIRIILIETSHPGNIGAAARAMKCMGLTRLYLVQPGRFPCAEATARASGADDVLAGAVVCDSLQEAVADCGLVIGASARQRRIPWPMLEPREAAGRALRASAVDTGVALVFGREHSGLTNEEMELCHSLVTIPTNPEFSSLNLAAAVQVLCYELRQCAGAGLETVAGSRDSQVPSATAEDMERLYQHLEQVMIGTGFLDPDKPRRLMRRLRRLFNRAGLDRQELQILRGFLAAIEK